MAAGYKLNAYSWKFMVCIFNTISHSQTHGPRGLSVVSHHRKRDTPQDEAPQPAHPAAHQPAVRSCGKGVKGNRLVK